MAYRATDLGGVVEASACMYPLSTALSGWNGVELKSVAKERLADVRYEVSQYAIKLQESKM